MVFFSLSKFIQNFNLHLDLKVKKKKKGCGSLSSPALANSHFLAFSLFFTHSLSQTQALSAPQRRRDNSVLSGGFSSPMWHCPVWELVLLATIYSILLKI